jgi:prepilin-type N-terminal cleavage/methylation domain-containing protein
MRRPPISTRSARKIRKSAHAGFTLVEVLVSMLVLVTVTAAVFDQINQMQKQSASEAVKLDLNQEAREFVDQTVRDLHMAGYPGANMYSDSLADTSKVAAGLVSVSPTQILLEGDINRDGFVSSVNIYYVDTDTSDPTCPCIRRSAARKIPGSSLAQPSSPNYSETEHVFPPGTGTGQSGEDLFSFYDQNGTPVDASGGVDISTPAGQTVISSIKTVKINLNLRSNLRDPMTAGPMRASMSATARLNH